MKPVTLYGTGIEASALGFGCSAMLGDRTREDALQMLHTAFDGGVRYFDVAPAYGQGLAEEIVGQFMANRRSQIIVATKFGIESSLPSVARSSFVRGIIRSVMRASPKLRRALGRASIATMTTRRFSPDQAEKSLERSLRLLRTNYIDVFLLHDCGPGDLSNTDELLHCLERMVQQGKIRCFGVGTSTDEAALIRTRFPPFAQVLQFANSVLIPGLQTVQPSGAAITFNPLSGSYAALRNYLRDNPSISKAWSQALDADCSDAATLSALMLTYAVQANNRGPVLFSSRAPERIHQNTQLLKGTRNFVPEQINKFTQLAQASGVTPI